MARRETPRLFDTMQQRFRAARFRQVQAMIDQLVARHGDIRILDAGGRPEYWNMLSPEVADRVQLTILNYSQELDDYSVSVGAHVRYEKVIGDACDMPQYADASFQLVHSNSVIEHVGSYAKMIAFANEVRRVGETYYVQTPNFWFPVDPHIAFPAVHWLPDPVRIALHTRFAVGLVGRLDFAGAASLIDDSRMIGHSTMRKLFPDARHSAERFGIIFKKSLIASRKR